VEDRGLGMPLADQDRMNRLLADPTGVDVGELLRDGRIGLFVVGAIARRHGITVRLQTNIYGGTQAVLILPPGLLGAPVHRHESWHETQPQPIIPAPRRESVRAAAPVSAAPLAYSPVTATTAADDRAGIAASGAPDQPTQLTSDWAGASPTIRESSGRPAVGSAEATPAGKSTPAQGAGGMERPQLPHRKPQAHLAPQLHDASRASSQAEEFAEPDPTLMATFTRAFSQGEAGAGAVDGSAGRFNGAS
jgi:hypothetical protein